MELRADEDGIYARLDRPCYANIVVPRAGVGWSSQRVGEPSEEVRLPAPPEGLFRLEFVDPAGGRAWLQPEVWPPREQGEA